MEAGAVEGDGGEMKWGRLAGEGVPLMLAALMLAAFLAAALSSVVRAAVPIPAVATVSVLHSAAVGGFVAGDVGAL